MDTYILITVILIAISFVISLFGSIVGFGGGIFMVPILITVFHYDLTTAVGSVMIALIPSSLISTYLNRRKGSVDFRLGILLEIPTILGVILGSMLLSFISARRLEILFALMVFFLGISFIIKLKVTPKKGPGIFSRLNKFKPSLVIKNVKNDAFYRVSMWMASLFGILSGTLAGLFGIGGGFLKTPIMIKVFKVPAKIATATALFMIVITSTSGTISHYYQNHIFPEHAWPVIVGFAAGAASGYKLNLKLNTKTIENLIGFALILAALVMMSKFIMNN